MSIAVCLTSAKCIHCVMSRGDNGDLVSDEVTSFGKIKWNPSTFAGMLLGEKSPVYNRIGRTSIAKVFEIHLSDDGCIKESSEFTLNGSDGTIDRNSIKPGSGKIPPACIFMTYAISFPLWLFITEKEWNSACDKIPGASAPGSMYAMACGKETVMTGVSSSSGAPIYKAIKRRDKNSDKKDKPDPLKEFNSFVNKSF